MDFEAECVIVCPHCWQTIGMTVDVSAGGQTLIQDCEVCCNPIELEYTVEEGQLAYVDARPAQ